MGQQTNDEAKNWKNSTSSIVWKYFGNIVLKRLNNPISIVLSNSIKWTCFPWCGNILEIKLPYCGRGPDFPENNNTKSSVEKLMKACASNVSYIHHIHWHENKLQ